MVNTHGYRRAADAAKEIGISKSTLLRLEKSGKIHPPRRINGVRVYTLDDISDITALITVWVPPSAGC